MKRALLVLVALACTRTKGPEGPKKGEALTPAQIAARVNEGVVVIKTNSQLGTGFVVWPDGRIATNLHVLVGATKAEVTLSDGRQFTDVEVLAVDIDHDLVVIRVGVKKLKPLPLGDVEAVQVGDKVVAIGNPLGLGHTVSDGLVSGMRQITPEFTLLQISAPIAPGSSGGPLLNERAEVIGVATMVSTEGQNLNFGVPVTYLKPLLLRDRGVPLARFTAELEASRPKKTQGTVKRDVPQHKLSLLDDCTPLADIELTLVEAIQVGAPLYNQGNFEGCYLVYEGAALKLKDKLQKCSGVKQALQAGLDKAQKLSEFDGKAWAMRDAFDGLLDVIRKKNPNP